MNHSNLSMGLVELVPRLRRHAQLLTNDRAIADRAVLSCLDDPALGSGDPQNHDLRLTALKAFYDRLDVIYDDDGVALAPFRAAMQGGKPAGRGAHDIEDRVVLLHSVEGLSAEQTAWVLSTDQDRVAEILNALRQAIMEQWVDGDAPILIIEDELFVAMDLSQILASMGLENVQMAGTTSDAVAASRINRFKLILADISLGDDGDGVDAVRTILKGSHVPAIFVTAYSERLVAGGGVEPRFVVSKPFSTEALKSMISRVLCLYAKPAFVQRYSTALAGTLNRLAAT